MAIGTVSTHINDTTGTVNTEFGIINVQIDSGVRVQVFPSTATIGAGQNIHVHSDRHREPRIKASIGWSTGLREEMRRAGSFARARS